MKVTIIPAKVSKFNACPLAKQNKRRVAGYARVSTDQEEQQSSYDAQVDYYTSYIQSRSDWEFVDVYTDEGISGTSTKRREGFKRMVSDALAGKIDMIVTKSVSRFARNTVDSLTTIRKLKEKGIEVYFEKENIWTFDGKGELLLTIMSSLAQEESRSISENCTWGQRKRFADGKVSIPFSQVLGFDRGLDGNLVVNQEEAVLVRRIFAMYLQGMAPIGIAAQLTKEGILSPAKKANWNAPTIRRMLSNEKYKGDALLQKQYTVDFLTKKQKVNTGEIPQYYVENNHEAIIQPATFDLVQQELARRSQSGVGYSGSSIFSNRIQCGECGCWYGPKVWHSTSKYRRVIWQCNHKFDKKRKCQTPHLTEEEIKQTAMLAINQLLPMKDAILKDYNMVKIALYDTQQLVADRKSLEDDLSIVSEMAERAIRENASRTLDQVDYQARYDELTRRFNECKAKLEETSAEIEYRQSRKKAMDAFLTGLKKTESILDKFDAQLWSTLVDHVTVHAKKDIRFTFKDSTEITVQN